MTSQNETYILIKCWIKKKCSFAKFNGEKIEIPYLNITLYPHHIYKYHVIPFYRIYIKDLSYNNHMVFQWHNVVINFLDTNFILKLILGTVIFIMSLTLSLYKYYYISWLICFIYALVNLFFFLSYSKLTLLINQKSNIFSKISLLYYICSFILFFFTSIGYYIWVIFTFTFITISLFYFHKNKFTFKKIYLFLYWIFFSIQFFFIFIFALKIYNDISFFTNTPIPINEMKSNQTKHQYVWKNDTHWYYPYHWKTSQINLLQLWFNKHNITNQILPFTPQVLIQIPNHKPYSWLTLFHNHNTANIDKLLPQYLQNQEVFLNIKVIKKENFHTIHNSMLIESQLYYIYNVISQTTSLSIYSLIKDPKQDVLLLICYNTNLKEKKISPNSHELTYYPYFIKKILNGLTF